MPLIIQSQLSILNPTDYSPGCRRGARKHRGGGGRDQERAEGERGNEEGERRGEEPRVSREGEGVANRSNAEAQVRDRQRAKLTANAGIIHFFLLNSEVVSSSLKQLQLGYFDTLQF